MTTGQRMKIRRKEIGLSAERVAERLGVSPATIYRYENGGIDKVPGDRLGPIAEVLQTTPSYLMGWDDAKSALSSAGMSIQDIAEEMSIPVDRVKEIVASNDLHDLTVLSKVVRVAELLAKIKPTQDEERDFAKNEHEERMLLLARHIAPIPEEQRNELIENFTSAADLYLKLMKKSPEDQ